MKINSGVVIGFVFGILAGGVSIYFLISKSYRSQINLQRTFIQSQAELIDSARTSKFVEMLDVVIGKINTELQNNPQHVLSAVTIGEISALSYYCKPYIHLMDDSLSERKYSPERGQLLLMLTKMKIDSGSIKEVMLKTTFSGAVLRDADLRGADMRWIDLKGADLKGSSLQGSNLYEAKLMLANLWGTNFVNANLEGADMTRADVSWSILNGANLKRTNLYGANFTSAQLRKSAMQGANFQWADLIGTFLNEANLSNANLFRTNLNKANLEKTDLSDAKLTLATLTEANLTGANLSRAEMTSVVVSEMNWMEKLSEWNVTGSSGIQSRFKVASDRSGDLIQYYLEKIQTDPK